MSTAAQRHNARQDAIWERCKAAKARVAKTERARQRARFADHVYNASERPPEKTGKPILDALIDASESLKPGLYDTEDGALTLLVLPKGGKP